MVGKTRYPIPSIGKLRYNYNTELLNKKKNLREDIAQKNNDLEGRMTVKDFKIR